MTTGLRSWRPAASAALGSWLALSLSGCAASVDIPGTGLSAQQGASGAGRDVPRLHPVDPGAYAEDLFERTNSVRADQELPALAVSPCAQQAAADRAAALVGGEELSHAPMDGALRECVPSTQAAENLSRASAPPGAVVEAWLGSAGHRANLLSETVTELGVACVRDDDAMVCSQVFLGP